MLATASRVAVAAVQKQFEYDVHVQPVVLLDAPPLATQSDAGSDVIANEIRQRFLPNAEFDASRRSLAWYKVGDVWGAIKYRPGDGERALIFVPGEPALDIGALCGSMMTGLGLE